jgi:hypothetical protein
VAPEMLSTKLQFQSKRGIAMANTKNKKKAAGKRLHSAKPIKEVKPLLNPQPLPPGRILIS